MYFWTVIEGEPTPYPIPNTNNLLEVKIGEAVLVSLVKQQMPTGVHEVKVSAMTHDEIMQFLQQIGESTEGLDELEAREPPPLKRFQRREGLIGRTYQQAQRAAERSGRSVEAWVRVE